jgi:hypothetical protein
MFTNRLVVLGAIPIHVSLTAISTVRSAKATLTGFA